VTPLASGDTEGRIRTVGEHEQGSRDDAHALRHEPVREVATRDGGAVLVRLAGELDLYNAHLVREALLGTLRDSPARIVVDLSEVTFIDSTGLGVLIEARSKLGDSARFLLAAPGLEARRALAITGLDRHFAVHDTVEDALAAEA
jgi:anti-sigma B factor antagonist